MELRQEEREKCKINIFYAYIINPLRMSSIFNDILYNITFHHI